MARPASRSFCGNMGADNEFKEGFKIAFTKQRGLLRRQSEMTIRPISTAKSCSFLSNGYTVIHRSNSVPSDLSTLYRTRKRGRSTIRIDGKNSPIEIRTQSVSFQPEVMMATAAAENDVSELQSILGSSETDVNYQSALGLTALHHAAANGCVEALQLLLDYEADINLSDSQGRTALDFAVRNGFFDCASILIKNGARADRMLNGGLHW